MLIWGRKVIKTICFGAVFSSVSLADGDYHRRDYGYWNDTDRDCQSTRQEVLIRDSLIPVSFFTPKKCRVKSGLWFDPYTGFEFNNPQRIDIDHIVPIYEAHVSGAAAFAPAAKAVFRNDAQNLIAVSASANRSKGQRDPAEWMPTNRLFWREYAILWIRTKLRWNLSFDAQERAVLDCLLARDSPAARDCG